MTSRCKDLNCLPLTNSRARRRWELLQQHLHGAATLVLLAVPHVHVQEPSAPRQVRGVRHAADIRRYVSP